MLSILMMYRDLTLKKSDRSSRTMRDFHSGLIQNSQELSIERPWKCVCGERGSGETLACGTGACAVAVASILNGYTEREVEIRLLGGNLQIEWNEEDNHVYMTGPATVVFDGEIEL